MQQLKTDMRKGILLVCSTLMLSLAAAGQNAVDAHRFTVDITDMNPLAYSTRIVSGEGYSFALRNDSVTFYLPYMGEAHMADFNTDGLNMSKPIYNQKWTKGKKGTDEIDFRCRRDMVEYQFHITLYPEGQAYIFLQPSNAQSISYRGNME